MYLKALCMIGVIGLLAAGKPLSAQPGMTDTTTQLKPVEISSGRLQRFQAGYTVRTPDSIALMIVRDATLADLLEKDGLIYIKRYGVGGLGSISMRGTSNVHTAIVWNGFNLQSPMNGGSDLNLFPVGFSDEIQIQSGGSCSLFGSGAIGGSIHLNNRPSFGSGLKVSTALNAGSYTNLGGSFQAENGTQKHFTSVRGFYRYGKNDFVYTNENLNAERMQHARLTQYGIMAGHHIRISHDHLLSVSLWWQENDREIPPALFTLNRAEQKDRTLRGSAEWKWMKQRWGISVRTLVNSENQHYTDTLTRIDSYNRFISYITDAEAVVNPGRRHRITIGLNHNLEQVRSDNYLSVVNRNRLALFTGHAYQSRNGKFRTSLSLLEEYNGKNLMLPVFSAGAEYAVIPEVGFRAAAARVYRIPTLNDLYWNPGGDPGLKPEQGWTLEGGLFHDFQLTKRLHFYKSFTVFSNHIDDWIVWLPAGAYWTPRNIQRVWSRGLESTLKLEYLGKAWNIRFSAQYNHTRATNQIARSASDASVGKQLIYTPEYHAAGGIYVEYRGFLLSYRHQFTDRRYTSSDNLDYLPSFQTGDVQLIKNFRFRQTNLRLGFGIDNLFDQRYLVIAGTPLPGRTFHTDLNINFNNPLKHQ